MLKFFTLLAALIPPFLYIPIIAGKNRVKNIFIYFGLAAGIAAGSGILIFKLLFLKGTIKPPSTETLTLTLFIAFIEAGLLEEIFKNFFYLLAEYFLGARKKIILKPFETFALGAFTGLGFGILENIYYALTPEFGEMSTVLARVYTAVLAHIIMNATFGYLRGKKINLLLALLTSVLIHAIYDFFALPSTLLGGILVRIFLVIGLGFCLWMGQDSYKRSKEL